MTAPISPRLMKGGIVTLDPDTGIPRGTIALQYNPDTLTRKLQPQAVGDQPDRSEILRLKGPPIETISVAAEIDATDQLAASDPVALTLGIQPQLAALEMLVYPSSIDLIINEALTLLGTIEILPMQSPLAVFVWSATRITPVLITSLDITEEAFDPNLNPIRAKVSLEMRVLNVNDTGFLNPAGALYMIYQIEKEALALSNAIQAAGSIAASLSVTL
ncbi:MAG TPA: hypothetical protein VHS58_18815 [Acetobacteraceae bacterium]|jgi:hypothetical protein|nr:hypothetical protein [Acetobacteraceae bacterium]